MKKRLLVLISMMVALRAMAAMPLIGVIEQEAGRVDFYKQDAFEHLGGVKLGYLPHEGVVSPDGSTAFIANFGLHDYDQADGIAGDTISIVDIKRMKKVGELKTHAAAAPHGIQLRPRHDDQLYVNTEKDHKMLVYDTKHRSLIHEFSIEPATHNFVFSQDGQSLWLLAGKAGIIRVDPDSGVVLDHFKLSTPIRGVKYTADQKYLLVSGKNEIALIDPKTHQIIKHYDNLNVDQILYSDITSDNRLIVAPAVWNNEVLVIDVKSGRIIKRIVTGVDPVWVKITADDRYAFVTNARGAHVSKIDLKKFTVKSLQTEDGPNGMMLFSANVNGKAKAKVNAKETVANHQRFLRIGVALPMSGEAWKKGREQMLGLEYWRLLVNRHGGIKMAGIPHSIQIIYRDTSSNPKIRSDEVKELMRNQHLDVLLTESHDYKQASHARDSMARASVHQLIPIIRFMQSSTQMQRLADQSAAFHDEDSLLKSYKNYYHLTLSNQALASVLTGVMLEKELTKQLQIPIRKGKVPGVLIVPPSNGVTKAEYRWANFLNKHGYASFIMDAFTVRGIKDRKSVGWNKAVKAQLADLVEAYYLLARAHQVDGNRIGLMGFSLGGFTVLKANQLNDGQLDQAISRLPIKAVASFYGNCHLVESPIFKAPVGMFIGEKDDRSMARYCQQMARHARSGKVIVHAYAGARHGLDNEDLPPLLTLTSETGQVYHLAYNPNAAKLAKKDLLNFLSKYL